MLCSSLAACGDAADGTTTPSATTTVEQSGQPGAAGTTTTPVFDEVVDDGDSTSGSSVNGTTVGGTSAVGTGNTTTPPVNPPQSGGHVHTVVTDPAVSATCQKTGLTEGSHCAVCKQVIVAQKTVAKTGHNYTYTFDAKNHKKTCSMCKLESTEAHTLTNGGKNCSSCSYKKETPPNVKVGSFSSKKTYVETDYVLYEIDPDIYVVNDLAAMTDEICRALEAATGLKFNNSQYGGKKVLVYIYRDAIPREDSEMSAGAAFAESGPSRSTRGDDCMHIIRIPSPCALFTGKTATLLHELAHTLRYCQSEAHFSTLLEEGFAEYSVVKTIEYLEKKKSATGFYLTSWIGANFLFDLMGFDYTTKNLLGWLSLDTNQFGGNQYPLGCNLMAYLDKTYSNFSEWTKRCTAVGIVSAQAQYDLLKSVYGDSFENGLYPWIKANPRTGEGTDHLYDPNSQNVLDLTGYPVLSMYPDFSNYGRFRCVLAEHSFKYKDLYISLEDAKHFLKAYKNRNIDNLQLVLSHDVTVQYFDKNGSMIKQSNERIVDVTDVSYIKLVGSGYLGRLDLLGYYPENMKYTDGQVIFTGVVDDASDGRNEFLTTADAGEAMEFAWDTELSYCKEYTLVLQLSDSCCEVTLVDRAWRETLVKNKTEIVISDMRYFAVYNPSNKPVNAKIVVKKGKR